MSTRLVILGLLRDKPLHGYELKHIVEQHMGDWTNIAFGSIYFALGKLAEEGSIEQVAVEQKGRRPSRSVYQITEAGRAEFLRLLREVWSDVEHHYYTIDIGLAFFDALPIAEVKGHLQNRIAHIEGILQHLAVHKAETLARADVPRRATAVFEHSRLHYEAELSWTRSVLAQVEDEHPT
jgi:DNA-binding PadR family transcriptional regulator